MVTFSFDSPQRLLNLRQLSKLLPVSYKTLHVYAKHGHNGVMFETSWFGGQRVSTLEAAQQFMDRCTQLKEATAPVVANRQQDVTRRLREKHGV